MLYVDVHTQVPLRLIPKRVYNPSLVIISVNQKRISQIQNLFSNHVVVFSLSILFT